MNKILISEVSKMYNISRPTLIYYDNIGLLSPYHDKETNYRYYSLDDIKKLDMILTLKESGLPLKVIKKFMESPTHEKSISLLEDQCRVIRNKINELQNLELLLEKKIDNFKEYSTLEFYDGIQVNYYESIDISMEPIDYSLKFPIQHGARSLKASLDSASINHGSIMSKYGLFISKNSLLKKDYTNYSYIFNKSPNNLNSSKKISSPSSLYACKLHLGSMDNIFETIEDILTYINISNYIVDGGSYLVPLIDSWATNNKKEYVTELLIPIIRK